MAEPVLNGLLHLVLAEEAPEKLVTGSAGMCYNTIFFFTKTPYRNAMHPELVRCVGSNASTTYVHKIVCSGGGVYAL